MIWFWIIVFISAATASKSTEGSDSNEIIASLEDEPTLESDIKKVVSDVDIQDIKKSFTFEGVKLKPGIKIKWAHRRDLGNVKLEQNSDCLAHSQERRDGDWLSYYTNCLTITGLADFHDHSKKSLELFVVRDLWEPTVMRVSFRRRGAIEEEIYIDFKSTKPVCLNDKSIIWAESEWCVRPYDFRYTNLDGIGYFFFAIEIFWPWQEFGIRAFLFSDEGFDRNEARVNYFWALWDKRDYPESGGKWPYDTIKWDWVPRTNFLFNDPLRQETWCPPYLMIYNEKTTDKYDPIMDPVNDITLLEHKCNPSIELDANVFRRRYISHDTYDSIQYPKSYSSFWDVLAMKDH